MKRSVLFLVVLGTASIAGADDRAARGRGMPRRLSSAVTSSALGGVLGRSTRGLRLEIARPTTGGWSGVSTEVARRVLAAKLTLDTKAIAESIAARDPSWIEIPPAKEKREFRPKVMLDFMSFPTGGSGLKVKIRF